MQVLWDSCPVEDALVSGKPSHHPLRRRQFQHSPASQQLCSLKPLTASSGLSLIKYKIGRMEKLRLREER